MNPVNIQKMAASFGLFSFGALSIDGVLMGASVLTGIFRGMVGSIALDGVVQKLQNQLGRPPEDYEIAGEMGVSMDELFNTINNISLLLRRIDYEGNRRGSWYH